MKRILLLLGGLLLLVVPAAAQEELPAVEGYIFKWETENIYPMGAHFRLTLSRPVESLREVTFTAAVNGQEVETVTIDLDEPIAVGPFSTEYDYVWAFPADAGIQLLNDESVIFEWRAVDDAGETASVRDVLIVRDERVAWLTDDDPQNRLDLTVAASGPSLTAIRQSVLLPYNLMSSNRQVSPRFNVLLYGADLDPSGCEMIQDEETGADVLAAVSPVSGAWLPCQPGRASALVAASGYDLVQSDGTLVNGAQAALVRLMIERFYESLWNSSRMPAWFAEGLTLFYQPATKAPLLLAVRDAARVNGLQSLSALATAQPDDRLWQAQSYALVLYMADQLGVRGLFDLANALEGADSFEAAYETVTGQALDALLPNLRLWVFTERAADAFNYTPYLAETPTPTPSPSRTPVPPTPTPTASATSTPTVTPTVTGVMSLTPTSTPTLTRTSTPRPATVTPRPAGSLFTPTPPPTPGPLAVLENPVNRLGIIAMLFIVLAVLALVYWLMSRRHD